MDRYISTEFIEGVNFRVLGFMFGMISLSTCCTLDRWKVYLRYLEKHVVVFHDMILKQKFCAMACMTPFLHLYV